jgi:hypothetical protein
MENRNVFDQTNDSKLTEIRAIPGNVQAIACLVEVLRARKPIAFVGSGASAGLYPLWQQLITRLANEAVRRNRADDAARSFWLRTLQSDPIGAASGIKQALGPDLYSALLYEIFAPRTGIDGRRYTRLQSVIVKLAFRGLVTTNVSVRSQPY